jgi:hypothetical protein
MALWQMTALAVLAVIAVLIGILLAYARLLTNKIGKTNATLRRIEEALFTANSLKGHLAPAHAQASAGLAPGSVDVTHGLGGGAHPETPTEPSAPAPTIPVPDTDRRISYLTVRDLKGISRSSRRGNDFAVGMNPFTGEPIVRRRLAGADPAVESAEATQAIAESGLVESVSSHMDVAVGNTERIYATFDEQLDARLDGLELSSSGLSSRSAVIEELAAATSEMREITDEISAERELIASIPRQTDLVSSLHAMDHEDVQPDFSATVSAASPEAATGVAPEEQTELSTQVSITALEVTATATIEAPGSGAIDETGVITQVDIGQIVTSADTIAVTVEERRALTAEIRATAIASVIAEEQPEEAAAVLDPDAEKRKRHIEMMAVAHRRRRRARH